MAESTASLLWTTVKNARSQSLNRELIGLRVEERAEPLSREELEAFARAIRDRRYLEAPDGEPSPFFVAKLCYPAIQRLMLLPGLGLNLLRMVHGQMEVRRHAPMPTDRPLDLTAELRDIQSTPAGELMEIACLVSSDGALALEGVVGLLVRGRIRTAKKSDSTEAAPEERLRIELQTEEGQQLEYARASGDRNFIHTSHVLARLAGLPRTIMHGMCVLAMTYNSLVEHLAGGSVARVRSLRARFGQAVMPGDRLTVVTHASVVKGEIPFTVLTPAGKLAIKNGHVEII